jgi:hypothetical protein
MAFLVPTNLVFFWLGISLLLVSLPEADGGASRRAEERVAEMLGAVVTALAGDRGDLGDGRLQIENWCLLGFPGSDDENGDENGEREDDPNRDPLSSPLSLTGSGLSVVGAE